MEHAFQIQKGRDNTKSNLFAYKKQHSQRETKRSGSKNIHVQGKRRNPTLIYQTRDPRELDR